MPIEVTCRKCGKVLVLKETMAGKSGKCPKCGNVIRVPRPLGIDEGRSPSMTAHVEGIHVRGGVKKEQVPLPGSALTGFTRSTVLNKVHTSTQALTGLMVAVVGMVMAVLPAVAPQLGAPPVLAIGGGLVGALGAAFAGWGFLNIRQQPSKFTGMGMAIAGLAVGLLALLVGLVIFSGGTTSAAGEANVPAGPAALESVGGKTARGACADKLRVAYKLLKKYADARRGKFPPSPSQLFPKYVNNLEAFTCPASEGGAMQYLYTPGLTTESPKGTPLLYDDKGYHEGGRNVLMVSGKVVWLTEEESHAQLEALKGESPTPAKGAPAEPAAEQAPAEGQGQGK